MLIGHTTVVKVPAVQPLHVCIIKRFKSVLRECWEDHVVKEIKNARDGAKSNPSYSNPSNNNNPSNNPKLSSPTRQDIVNWVHREYVFLQWSKITIQRSFKACAITTTHPGRGGSRAAATSKMERFVIIVNGFQPGSGFRCLLIFFL